MTTLAYLSLQQGRRCIYSQNAPNYFGPMLSCYRCSEVRRLWREAHHSLHLLPRLRMSGAKTRLLRYGFISSQPSIRYRHHELVHHELVPEHRSILTKENICDFEIKFPKLSVKMCIISPYFQKTHPKKQHIIKQLQKYEEKKHVQVTTILPRGMLQSETFSFTL